MSNKNLLILFVSLILTAFSTSVSAIGKVCSNFEIIFENASSDEIKVTKFQYYDFKNNKWKTEKLFGLDGHQKINPGQSWPKERDLEKVEDRDTKFRATFKRRIGGNKWKDSETIDTDFFVCRDNGRETVTIPEDIAIDQSTDIIHGEGSELAEAAAAIQEKYPNMREAQKATDPKFIDSHVKNFGTGHAELKGYGVTMIAHNGSGPKPSTDKLAFWNDELDEPTELFYEKGGALNKKKWKIIGMGYGKDFTSSTPPVLAADGQEYEFLVHEAGYHKLGDGGFECAENEDIKNKAWDDGVRIDAEGFNIVTRDNLKPRKRFGVRHGRIWTLHVWFEPDTGLPLVAPTDPWERQSFNALSVPSCAFYAQG